MSNHWTGLLDWNTGMHDIFWFKGGATVQGRYKYWTGLLDWCILVLISFLTFFGTGWYHFIENK